MVDVAGQRINASDRLYLAEAVPTLIVWGDRDAIIPVVHGRVAHSEIPGSRFVVVEGAGHFLPLQEPEALAEVIGSFLDETKAAERVPEGGRS